jgi:hypothetical protein
MSAFSSLSSHQMFDARNGQGRGGLSPPRKTGQEYTVIDHVISKDDDYLILRITYDLAHSNMLQKAQMAQKASDIYPSGHSGGSKMHSELIDEWPSFRECPVCAEARPSVCRGPYHRMQGRAGTHGTWICEALATVTDQSWGYRAESWVTRLGHAVGGSGRNTIASRAVEDGG